MTPWLQKRLLALTTVAVVLSGTYVLHAQNAYPPPPKTPEEAATKFYEFLEIYRNPDSNTRRFASTQDFVQYQAALSRPQFEALGARGNVVTSENFIQNLVIQSQKPSFSAQVTSQDGNKTIVNVAPVKSDTGKEVVVIAEDGGYRVDLFATYAKWNNLSGAELDRQIYELTGVISPTLQGNALFMSNVTRSQCQSQLKQQMLGIMQYIQDYDEKLPPARKWHDVIIPYIKSEQIFTCPALIGKSNGYAFNQNLSQLGLARINNVSTTLSIYETSNLGRNVFGPFTGRAYRHFDGQNLAFSDGHVKWFGRDKDKSLNAKP